MSLKLQLYLLVSIFTFFFFIPSSADGNLSVPKFTFSWLDDNNAFLAGDTAVIMIKVLGNFDSKGNASLEKSAFRPALTVNGKMGNSCYISGVLVDTLGEDTGNWRILFMPIMVGLFNLIVSEDPFQVFDSSLHFNVEPGKLYASVSVASLMGQMNQFEAGSTATVLILPKDAFGNNVSLNEEEPSSFNFTFSTSFANGSFSNRPNITHMGWNEFGYVAIEFIVTMAGNFLLNVEGGNQTLNSSPLPFTVNPGPLDVTNCVAKSRVDNNAWQIFSKMEIYIHQQDQYGNLIPGIYEFDADIVEQETNLSIPVADLHFEEVFPGIQLFSYNIQESGNFLLTVSDMKHNKSISNMPYEYYVFVGYCDGSSSVVNGSGLNNSVAGESAQFSVYLNDNLQYPSPVEVERLRVEIIREIDSFFVLPKIIPRKLINGSGSREDLAPAPVSDWNNTLTSNLKVEASAFDVVYTPEQSGLYKILVFCGNIVLNGGRPFLKEVKPGEVNISLSGVIKFASKVPKLIRHEIVVELFDSFLNPVHSQQSRLKLDILSMNSSGFSTWMFTGNYDGSYSGHYLAMDVGTYEMCVLLDGINNISPCPFVVNVYSSQYFPIAYDDVVSVWEDESIAFDALANDYYAGDNASIIEFSRPRFGSLLQSGRVFRYTPYKDYIGNDSFLYTISDVNGNLATGVINIYVLSIPPQFVSFPIQLQATEDVISPRFGGYAGFEIRYSETAENVSITLTANHGRILLSSTMMQFWKPMWDGLSITNGGDDMKDLVLEGSAEAINVALQSIQYIGNENFYGEDTIRVSARNKNGKNNLEVPVLVDPVNDPPFIQLPKYVVLKSNADESQIFDRGIGNFNFSIGDPDAFNFPGGASRFLISISIEVSEGLLLTTLPAELINATELKLEHSYQWQPLVTYVTISKLFMVRAKGVRFRATVKDCNTVMQQLIYHSEDHDSILTVKVNDLGHHGCYLNCYERISMPLHAEATILLIRKGPMSSFSAHSLGSAIVVEFLMVFFLGAILLFFSCKCAFHLASERRISHSNKNLKLSRLPNADKPNSKREIPKDATCFFGCFSSSFMLGRNRCFNFCQG